MWLVKKKVYSRMVREKVLGSVANPYRKGFVGKHYLVFADAYIVAALECGLPCRAFSSFSVE